MLLHFHALDGLSLTEIARSCFVSKGTVSKFIAQLTQQGTFEAFRGAVEFERHELLGRQRALSAYARQHAEHPLPARAHAAAAGIARAMRAADRVLIVTPRNLGHIVDPLVALLLGMGVRARIVHEFFRRDVVRATRDLAAHDLLIFVPGHASTYEWTLRITSEFDVTDVIASTRAETYLIGTSHGPVETARTIDLHDFRDDEEDALDGLLRFVCLTYAILEAPSAAMRHPSFPNGKRLSCFDFMRVATL